MKRITTRRDGHSHRLITGGCKELLAPIVRLLLKNGITWQDFSEVARHVFVEVATLEFGSSDRPGNISRTAALTGMTRREVRRQRDQIAPRAKVALGDVGPAARVLSRWHQDREFLGVRGKPRDLPLRGAGASFAELVRRHGGDSTVTALLEELRTGSAIIELPDGQLRAVRRALIPRPMEAAQFRLWASALRDMATTLEHNVTRDKIKAPRFERRALNQHVDRNALMAFRQLLEIEGQAFLERVDDWLAAHEVRDAPGADSVRLGVGLYHIEDVRFRGQLK